MQNDVQLSIAQQEDNNPPYEKPRLGMVRLFADQILQGCPNNTAEQQCTGSDPLFS